MRVEFLDSRYWQFVPVTLFGPGELLVDSPKVLLRLRRLLNHLDVFSRGSKLPACRFLALLLRSELYDRLVFAHVIILVASDVGTATLRLDRGAPGIASALRGLGDSLRPYGILLEKNDFGDLDRHLLVSFDDIRIFFAGLQLLCGLQKRNRLLDVFFVPLPATQVCQRLLEVRNPFGIYVISPVLVVHDLVQDGAVLGGQCYQAAASLLPRVWHFVIRLVGILSLSGPLRRVQSGQYRTLY